MSISGVEGTPDASNFGYEPCDGVQPSDLKPGEALIKTLYLSVDPAQVRHRALKGTNTQHSGQMGQNIKN